MFELLLGRDNNPLATGLGAVPVFALGDQQAEALTPAVLGLAGGVMAVAAVAGLLMPAQAGASVEPAPFHPVIRGKLITGDESLNLQADIAGGGGEGVSSLDYLW